ncbi:hypothetical protein EXIGLDRAFT_828524 [Exidia glandulosa HHB12029]|uniref:Uncharacterized protein n=1 Tax=Exidia glandulosa HHB12029 TaxID=1314781 RepID=A0A165QIX2_EXIGL|nr:hypothetical protein EXIGLDRAFT_828524 [Exidia glandulosa HHB12029]
MHDVVHLAVIVSINLELDTPAAAILVLIKFKSIRFGALLRSLIPSLTISQRLLNLILDGGAALYDRGAGTTTSTHRDASPVLYMVRRVCSSRVSVLARTFFLGVGVGFGLDEEMGVTPAFALAIQLLFAGCIASMSASSTTRWFGFGLGGDRLRRSAVVLATTQFQTTADPKTKASTR